MTQRHRTRIDPVTGYETTGHDWGGIQELNTPFPKIAAVALLLTFVYSVVAWVLLPAWPTGRDYTRGLWGLDQGRMARDGHISVGPDPNDRRARRVTMTTAGRRLWTDLAQPKIRAYYEEALAGFSVNDSAHLLHYLLKMLDNMKRLDQRE